MRRGVFQFLYTSSDTCCQEAAHCLNELLEAARVRSSCAQFLWEFILKDTWAPSLQTYISQWPKQHSVLLWVPHLQAMQTCLVTVLTQTTRLESCEPDARWGD